MATSLPTVHPTHKPLQEERLASSANRLKLSLDHFDFFMEGHCAQICISHVKAKDLPCHGVPPQPDQKAIFTWWASLIGAWWTYLSTYTAKGCKAGGAIQRAGDVRKHFCDEKFPLDPPIPVFHGRQWTDLRTKCEGKFREHH